MAKPIREDDTSWVEIRREGTRLKLYGSHGFVLAQQSSNVLHLRVDRKGVWI